MTDIHACPESTPPDYQPPLLQWLDDGKMQRAVIRISFLSWLFIWCLFLTAALAITVMVAAPLGPGKTTLSAFLTMLGCMVLLMITLSACDENPRGQEGPMVLRLSHVATWVLSIIPFRAVQDFGLFVAVFCDRKKAVRKHLRRGADINLCLPKQGSVLHLALVLRNYRMAHYLISQGARVDGLCERYGDILGNVLAPPGVPWCSGTLQSDKWLRDNAYSRCDDRWIAQHDRRCKAHPWVGFFDHTASWYLEERARDRAVLRKIVRLRGQTPGASRVGNIPLKAVGFLEAHAQCVRQGERIPSQLVAQFMGLFETILEQQKVAPSQQYRGSLLARCARLQRRHANQPHLGGLYGQIEAVIAAGDLQNNTLPTQTERRNPARL